MNLLLWGMQQGDTILLDMRNGLSESRVRSIRQMPDGRIAIATTTTIDIFDGTRFFACHLLPERAYPLPEYMGNRQMNCDTLGYIWLRNKQTLYVVDSRRRQVVADVKGLMRERNLTNDDVAGWPTAPPPPTPLTWEGVFRDETVTAYTHDAYGGLWIGTKDHGILYVNPHRSHKFQTVSTPFPYEPCPIYCSPRASRLSARFAPSGTNCSYEESERYLYLGTLNGVLVIDSRDNITTVINEEDGLKSSNVTAIAADRRNNIWVTTASGGISRITVVGRDSFDIVNYGLLDGINIEGREFQMCSIHKGEDGHRAVGFADGMVTFHPDSLAGARRYTFHIPRHSFIAGKELTPNAENGSPWGWWLFAGTAIAGGGFLLWRKERTKKRRKGRKHEPVAVQYPQASDETVDKLKGGPSDTPTQDELFLKKLQQVVEKNIDNEDFSVQQLSEEMAMDRTVLFRRMQMLNLGSPSAYIKRIRMEVAVRLLRETGLSINEIVQTVVAANTSLLNIKSCLFVTGKPPAARNRNLGDTTNHRNGFLDVTHHADVFEINDKPTRLTGNCCDC